MRPRLQRLVLLIVVFISGMTSLAVELSASRLLVPFFGDSLFIWANLIGMELIYLSIGYALGGRWADRHPSPVRLYGIVAVAAAFIGLVPLIARPILRISLYGFANLDFGAFYGSLLGTILLFAIPVILLGMVSPFAIRLEITKLDSAGNTAGQIYALSTVGSIVGTFVPVFVFIPTVGTNLTFAIFAAALFAGALVGLAMSLPNRAALARIAVPTGLAVLVSLVGGIFPYTIKPGYGGTLIYETESLYNYIQVVKNDGTYELVLNEGQAIHSLYNPSQPVSGGEWQFFLPAPFFNRAPYTPSDLKTVCVIGLGAGTIPRNIDDTFGTQAQIDGVELDPKIVQLGRQYFAMNEPNLHVIVNDGRYYLETTAKKYDFIAIDAYQQPYIPFQLTTREFFSLVRSHLTPQGVVAINVLHTLTDFRLVNALAATMSTVFHKVYAMDVLDSLNTILVGTNDDNTSLGDLSLNLPGISQPLLHSVVAQALDPSVNLRDLSGTKGLVFTDNHAPVETIIDQIILGYIRQNSGPTP
jgi:spermidine synthase